MTKTNYEKQMELVAKLMETPKERVDFYIYKITSKDGRIFISYTKGTLDELKENILNDTLPYDIIKDKKMSETIGLEKETLLIEFIGIIESAEEFSAKDLWKYISKEYDKEVEKNPYIDYLSSYKTKSYKRK